MTMTHDTDRQNLHEGAELAHEDWQVPALDQGGSELGRGDLMLLEENKKFQNNLVYFHFHIHLHFNLNH